ncbi:putative bifunctional diguanylate cyclase/phosphodiesterase [Altererythrobacter sp. MF3-039]|uniref:putative bifunctional diguanylate cyclase/phosphodiesterase n=1 Tax=Altererythrobacter sp. MF3-039 TaxID=3252901 RepID=UPI00390C7549
MSKDNGDLIGVTPHLPTSVVLGFKSPENPDWAGLRGLQHVNVARRAVVRLTLSALAAVLVVGQYLYKIDPLLLSAWVFSLTAALVYTIRLDRLINVGRGRGRRAESIYHQTAGPIALALVWAFALVIFPAHGTVGDHMAVWIACGLLVLGSILGRAAIPLGTLVFTAIVSVAGIAGFYLQGHYPMVGVIFAFAIIASLRTIDGARVYLSARIAEGRALEKSEVVSLLLREYEENEADWLWEIDRSRRLRAVSPRFAYALGRDTNDVAGKTLLELISGTQWESGDFSPSLRELSDHLDARESFSNLMVKVLIDGTAKWWELSGTPVHDERGVFLGFRGVGSDVTAQRESSEKIAYLARYDTLTSLPNRLMLNETLGAVLAKSDKWRSRCAFLMVDLDRFKSINDSLGHLVGDKLLAQVSDRLRSLMDEDDMCGRLGGDEFGVVLRDANDASVVAAKAEKIIERLSEPYRVNNQTLYVGASVGSALGPRDGETVEEILRNADLALYRAKDEGGGSHFAYMPSLHAVAEERRKLEVSLRDALPNNEFELHFQPVVDANNEELVSFEALARWQSSEHGPVSPAKFVPIAEDTRLIVPIGQWVLEQACIEANKWPEALRIAVNVSPEQLLEPEFSSDVVRALAKSGLAPQRLEIEVTESIFLRDASIARNALEQVMALGCSVALDDFGTGYSSLGYLRKLQFSTIKIDRTFVQGAAQDSAESLAIIRAVVAMADSLGMTTTAEGVETVQEAKLLRELGCTKIQGYYYGRPMSADDAGQIIKRSVRRLA